MLKDPRSTKYIYNLQIIAPPNNHESGKHIVIGSNKNNNLKFGYDKESSWIKSNGPLEIISKNDTIKIGDNMKINKEEIKSTYDKIQNMDSNGNGYVWFGNTINFNSGIKINSISPIELNSGLLIKNGNYDKNTNLPKTSLPDQNGNNVISGNTLIYGNVSIDGNTNINKNLTITGNIRLLGGKKNNIQLGNTLLPDINGNNILNGDTNINGKLNISDNLLVNNNIASTSLNVSGNTVTTTLQVDGISNVRGINSTDTVVIKGGKSNYNLNNYPTVLPYINDGKNYIRGDTEITGNLNLPGDINVSNINIDGNINLSGSLNKNGNELLPSGIICMWSGSISNIPKGWALCDGTNNTPDLRSKFVIGASLNKPPNKTLYTVGSNGGNEFIALTTDNLPPHSHSLSFDRPTLSHNCWKNGNCGGPNLVDSGSWSGNTSIEGKGLPFNNMPPYYALAFIIKT
jgi:microcystin-dependent protein/cytoskeletal protein CcmA (bactofilin family)